MSATFSRSYSIETLLFKLKLFLDLTGSNSGYDTSSSEVKSIEEADSDFSVITVNLDFSILFSFKDSKVST